MSRSALCSCSRWQVSVHFSPTSNTLLEVMVSFIYILDRNRDNCPTSIGGGSPRWMYPDYRRSRAKSLPILLLLRAIRPRATHPRYCFSAPGSETIYCPWWGAGLLGQTGWGKATRRTVFLAWFYLNIRMTLIIRYSIVPWTHVLYTVYTKYKE